MADPKDILKEIGDRVFGASGVRLAFGDPIHAQGKTIIPVARAAFGFGAGLGGRSSKGEGGGGGGGGRATPAGVVEITPESTRFIRFHPWRPLLIAAAAGALAGFVLGRRIRAHTRTDATQGGQ